MTVRHVLPGRDPDDVSAAGSDSPVPPTAWLHPVSIGMKSSIAVSGIHGVRAALKHGHPGVAEVWLERRRRDGRLAQIAELANAAGIPTRWVTQDDLDSASEGANHQGVLAWVRAPAARNETELYEILERAPGPVLLLVLDGVQDPHNLGACLRTADAAGVQAVIAPKDNAVGLTPAACKVASGAAQSVPYIQVTNLSNRLEPEGAWHMGCRRRAGRRGTLLRSRPYRSARHGHGRRGQRLAAPDPGAV